MTDYSMYSKTIADGESALLELELWESSPEGNGISDIADISEVEIEFELRDDGGTFDQSVVTMTFNEQ